MRLSMYYLLAVTAALALLISPVNATTLQILGEYVFPELKQIVEQGIDAFFKETGRQAFHQVTLRMDEAIVRAVALGEPVDLMIIPRSDLLRYHEAEMFYPLGQFLVEEMSELDTIIPSETFIWGRIDDVLSCLYVANPSGAGARHSEPAMACIPRLAKDASVAWELAKQLVLAADSTDTDRDVLDNFFYKLITEKDYRTIYRQLVHPDRKQENTGDPDDWTEERFIRYMHGFDQRIQPVLSFRSVGPRPRLPDPGMPLTYTGDPTGRKDYEPQYVRPFWYEVVSGERWSLANVHVFQTTLLPISLHVQPGETFPRRYIFHSPEYGFEQFWFTYR